MPALRWPRATNGKKIWPDRERIKKSLLRRCSSNSFKNSRYRGVEGRGEGGSFVYNECYRLGCAPCNMCRYAIGSALCRVGIECLRIRIFVCHCDMSRIYSYRCDHAPESTTAAYKNLKALSSAIIGTRYAFELTWRPAVSIAYILTVCAPHF